ncbi:hypothetical protein CXG81DRAFT_18253 [Caulochytrium protostelioides]|uniref:Uncharacterized protein n=1 Tax=Caulochytrium protostelioides TaxID=1555241 RepID=A0A4P9X9J4_9FUNG|nr:hypothetical protein CXG81DRAFT_18253 [Caulochytrium protostelioides]|eukprot:RKP02017.1 hypothetical protein CXG81DRAFT_18253 [Caulochytrium protostelioides]
MAATTMAELPPISGAYLASVLNSDPIPSSPLPAHPTGPHAHETGDTGAPRDANTCVASRTPPAPMNDPQASLFSDMYGAPSSRMKFEMSAFDALMLGETTGQDLASFPSQAYDAATSSTSGMHPPSGSGPHFFPPPAHPSSSHHHPHHQALPPMHHSSQGQQPAPTTMPHTTTAAGLAVQMPMPNYAPGASDLHVGMNMGMATMDVLQQMPVMNARRPDADAASDAGARVRDQYEQRVLGPAAADGATCPNAVLLAPDVAA